MSDIQEIIREAHPILFEKIGKVALITLNRPEARAADTDFNELHSLETGYHVRGTEEN